MRIAVDVMGGDHGCGVIVDGVLQALEEFQALNQPFWSDVSQE